MSVMSNSPDCSGTTLSIERLTCGWRRIHVTKGDGTGYEAEVSDELFQEMRKAFSSDAMMVEVGPFTEGKCREV